MAERLQNRRRPGLRVLLMHRENPIKTPKYLLENYRKNTRFSKSIIEELKSVLLCLQF